MKNEIDNKYMIRCLQLAKRAKGYVSPNPMVGAVVVHDGEIIGEGFHQQYGKAHAEVNAINGVEDKSLLKDSTLYVSLEPCSHYGKTPPCAQLIIDSKIPRVVVAMADPYPKVSGRGIKMLEDAGVEVILGVLEDEAKELNKDFVCAQVHRRPYIYLKWAQTKDGFIDKARGKRDPKVPTPISNDFTMMMVHKLRSEVDAIMIGTNTAIVDNPSLTTRLWAGHSPLRVVIDRQMRIPSGYTLFNNQVDTLIFTEDQDRVEGKNRWVKIGFDEKLLINILAELNKLNINSLLVEGGATLLQSFIDQGLWDEVFVEIADKEFNKGVEAPSITNEPITEQLVNGSKQLHFRNRSNI